MHCIIGSGPAGVACAKALLARGAGVLMLDAGIELEADRTRVVRKLAGEKYSDWSAEELAFLKGDVAAGAKGIPLKMLFGSDFPYRETEKKIPWHGRGVGFRPSLALGGLSNVWGAAMLPYRDEDIAGWPVQNSDLQKHYRAATEISGLAGVRDDLDEILPLHGEPKELRSSRQAERFLRHLNRHRKRLHSRGWRFGRSRLAVRAADSPRGVGCVYCSQCMTGCVYGCIYNAADTVRELQQDKHFLYQRDVIVTRLRESGETVCVEGFHRQTRAPLSFEADRVYLAAGVIPTAQIVLRSQNAYDRPLTLRDSQYFLFPILMARGAGDVRHEALYTLSQVFIELQNRDISSRSVHLQIYTYSDIIAQALRQSLGPLKPLAGLLEKRLLIVQGYLHSDESAAVEMTLKHKSFSPEADVPQTGENDFLQLDAKLNPQTRSVIKKVLRELGQSGAMGGMVLSPMLQVADPGRGYHIGGSIPMRQSPGPFEADVLGRPHGWSRLHVVDASVLPDVPATTITLSVMANAHRIGWETA